MIQRNISISKNSHLLLVGPRGSGKSTLIREIFSQEKTLWIDLLGEGDEERYGLNPDRLSETLKAESYDYIIIDEVQKFPKLLDIVHKEIESKHNQSVFILTGSSARKLKRGHANLLAGRLFLRELLPFNSLELEENFNLEHALNWGLLPKTLQLKTDEELFLFLRSYCRTYIREEVLMEQLIRKIEIFRDFLPVAAQSNGKIINYSKIAALVGTSDHSIKSYFSILEDTLIGFFLPPFHRSIRKRQRQAPKFYFFDTGVKKALDGTLRVPLVERTSEYGHAFEHFIILECIKLDEVFLTDFKFSYYLTKDGLEIDLIIERPGKADLLLEIKSTSNVDQSMVRNLISTKKGWDRSCELEIWSREKVSRNIDGVLSLYWRDGLKKLFNDK